MFPCISDLDETYGAPFDGFDSNRIDRTGSRSLTAVKRKRKFLNYTELLE